jgi:hypothetical protein
MMFCSCCMAEITAPVWIKDKPYGWKCAEKLTGTKLDKPKREFDVTKDVRQVLCPVNSEGTAFLVQLVLMNPETGKRTIGSWYCTKRNDSFYIRESALRVGKSKIYLQPIN